MLIVFAGLFSVIMRDMSNLSNTECPKWIVLDGDIDTMWIESLNTVMDDNKVTHTCTHTHACTHKHMDTILLVIDCIFQVLTLASNERIPLTPSRRLMFEIGHLRTATPATVSRAGILFVNPADLGWNP